MKKFILLVTLLLGAFVLFAQATVSPEVPPDVANIEDAFVTMAALIAFIPFVVQILRNWIMPDEGGLTVQIFSWSVGIVITLAGWLAGLGFLDGLLWWQAVLYGLGACLAANGIFDTGLILSVFSLFRKN